jgi:biopolymer transport protein ExbD
MSHGPSSEGSSAEPNLTPLLDVVMQLLMFFMMCVNFVSEQVSEDIKLPVSESARPMDKTETDVLFINLRPFRIADFKGRPLDEREKLAIKFKEEDPCILVVGRFPMKILELQVWLKEQYEFAQKQAAEKGDKDKKVNTAIIIRAHKDTEYSEVYKVLNMCKVVGYKTLKLRAMTKGGPE